MTTAPVKLNTQFVLLANPIVRPPRNIDDSEALDNGQFVVLATAFGSTTPDKLKSFMPGLISHASYANPLGFGPDGPGGYPVIDPARMYGLWQSVKGAPPITWAAPSGVNPGQDQQGDRDKLAFYRWANAKGYNVGQVHVGNDATGWTFTNVFARTATGALSPVGKWEVIQDDPDVAFGIAISLMAGFMGIGWVSSVGNASMSNNWTGAALAVAKSASGVDTPDVPAEQVTMDGFDDTLGSAWSWDGFNFSDSESVPLYSDAQITDFGFGTPSLDATMGAELDVNGFGAVPAGEPSFGSGEYHYGGTPEVTTNDFGTQFSPEFSGSDAIKTASTGVQLAQAGAVLSRTGASSRASDTSKPRTGSNDTLGTFGSVLTGLGNAAAQIGSTAAQMTTAAPRTFSGQLTPTGGASVAGVPFNALLLVGVVLIGAAVVLHMKG